MARETWTTKKLHEVLDVLSGGAWGTHDDPNGPRVLRTNNISPRPILDLREYAGRAVPKRLVDRLRMQNGDILMTKSNSLERVGDCGLFEQPEGDSSPYLPSNFCQVLRFSPQKVDPWFGLFWLRSAKVRRLIKDAASGTSASLKNISARKLRELAIDYPEISEQRRIVSKVRQCFERFDEITSIQEEMSNYPRHTRGGYVLELLGLDTLRSWNEAYEHSGDFHWTALDDVCTLVSRGRHSKQGQSDTYLIKTRHVWPDGVKDYSDCRLADTEAVRVKDELIVGEFDVLLACSARGSLGRTCFFASAPELRVTVDTHVAILRANPERILPRFLFEFLNSPLGRYLLVSAEAGGRWHEEKIGFRFAELNLQDLKRIKVPVPQLSRQEEIATRLASIDEVMEPLVNEASDIADMCEIAREAVLRQAFAGEL